MKKSTIIPLPLLLVLSLAPLASPAQPSANPPGKISYQGFLTDAGGFPLATNAPRNYTVVFRIYDASTGGHEIWAEQQVVTVDRGYFTVMLGNGSSIDPNFTNDLTSVFSGPSASDRYLGMTVNELSPNELAPRLRLLASPYAFLARSAGKLVSSSGSDLITSSGTTVTVNGQVTAASFSGTFNGTNINSSSIDMTKLAAAVQQALCPPGTILAYGGDTAPPGWFLCDGQQYKVSDAPNLYAAIGTHFGGSAIDQVFNVPDLRGRFLRGWDHSAGRDPDSASRTAMAGGGSTGDAVGSIQADAFKSHTHVFHTAGQWTPGRTWQGSSGTPSSAYVQDGQTDATGGSETRPINAYVNYIMKK